LLAALSIDEVDHCPMLLLTIH